MLTLPWHSPRIVAFFVSALLVITILHLCFGAESLLSREEAKEKGSWFGPKGISYSGILRGYKFDPARDARHFGLSEEQCDTAFPKFYHEIDRAASWWTEREGIRPEHVETAWQNNSGIVRLLIHDQQLYILNASWVVPAYDVGRGLALLHSINRAIVTSTAPLPNVEFTINVGDWPDDLSNSHPVWVLSRSVNDTSKWVMPDFGYWSWPLEVLGEYNEVRSRIALVEPEWKDKQARLVWRGATHTNLLREALINATRGREWSDVEAVYWKDGKPVIGGGADSLSIPEHCDYKYVAHTEGHSYSGRGKYLLNCNSVSVIHTPEWIEPHTHLYRHEGPNQNIVLVQRNFTDLDHAMQELLDNDSVAQRIASNNIATFRDRYLTPAAQACYWRRMIRTWATVMTFTPEAYIRKADDHIGQKGKEQWTLRGIPYESFVSNLYDPNTVANRTLVRTP